MTSIPIPAASGLRLLLVAAAGLLPASTRAQQPATPSSQPPPRRPAAPYVNRNLIFLDPAHGGEDSGAHLSADLLEKDLTFAITARIRSRLSEAGINVLLSREADSPDSAAAPPTLTPAQVNDQRAGAANHARPVACLLIHASGSGSGVHLVTSALPPSDPAIDTPPPLALSWDSAQAASVAQSIRLANVIGLGLAHAGVPVHLTRASVRPLDNLTCPAVAVELAPLNAGTPLSNSGYQQRVADTVAAALIEWRRAAEPPPAPKPQTSTPAPSQPAPSPSQTPPRSSATPNPRSAPASTAPPTQPPAPVLRRPPSPALPGGANP